MKYNSVAHAIDDLSKGKSIVIIDDQNEKIIASVITCGAYITNNLMEQLCGISSEPLCIAISQKIATELRLPYRNKKSDP